MKRQVFKFQNAEALALEGNDVTLKDVNLLVNGAVSPFDNKRYVFSDLIANGLINRSENGLIFGELGRADLEAITDGEEFLARAKVIDRAKAAVAIENIRHVEGRLIADAKVLKHCATLADGAMVHFGLRALVKKHVNTDDGYSIISDIGEVFTFDLMAASTDHLDMNEVEVVDVNCEAQ